TYNNTFTGSGSLDVYGPDSGAIILTGSDQVSSTTIAGGATLQLGNGTTNGSVTGSIVDNAILKYLQTTPQTFSNTITGSGQVTDGNSNEITLPNAAGTLTLGQGC